MARRFSVCHRYLLLLTTLLLSVALPGFAQPNQGNAEAGLPVIESYNARAYNGFPQIWTILQDRRGIMYFGNSGGEILEYDGVTWRKITTANIVRSLAIDDDGKIWFGSNANFGYLAPDAAGTLNTSPCWTKFPPSSATSQTFGKYCITPKGLLSLLRASLPLGWQTACRYGRLQPNPGSRRSPQVHGHIYVLAERHRPPGDRRR